jgi:phenylalanyl-tRNA synthetase beta chain
MKVRLSYINKMLGLDLTVDDAAAALERMGFGIKEKGKELDVQIPPYRGDLLHPIDLVEDVAIGYGYERFEPVMPMSVSFGMPRQIEETSRMARESLVGLGFLEIATLTLSNDEDQFSKLGAEVGERSQVLNPLTTEYTNLRVSLMPSLLLTLQRNKHRDYPQKIFEVADVIVGAKNRRHVSAASCHSAASFTEMKSSVQRFLEDLRHDFRLEKSERPGFIKGRCATIIHENEIAGHFGEIHPQTLENFEITNPVAAMEFNLEIFKR